MKKVLSVFLAAVLVLSFVSSLSAFGADVADSWTVLERDGEGENGTLTVDGNGAFLLSSGNWGGYGVGSKKMYPFDEANPIVIGANVTLGTVCPTGEGAEPHRYFSVILTNEALTYTTTAGATSLPGSKNYVELRIYDTNALDGSKMASVTAAGFYIAYATDKTSVTVAIPDFDAKTDANAEITVKVKGNDIEFWFNGKLLITMPGVARAFNGKTYLSFGVSAYGYAQITDSAVKTINGTPANSSSGTLEPDVSGNAVLDETKWTLCVPPEQAGELYMVPDGSFLMDSQAYGGVGVFSAETVKIRNMEMTVDLSLPVGNIATGGADYLRGFSLVFAVNAVSAMEIIGATAIPTDEGWLEIRITDDEAMDGTKNLYIIPSGSIANASFGDIEGPVNEPIKIEGINAKENANIEINVITSGKNLTVKVNGTEVATVEGIMKGFYGRASVGFTATSYGYALCQGAHIKLLNGEAPNGFDINNVVMPEEKTSGCGNKG